MRKRNASTRQAYHYIRENQSGLSPTRLRLIRLTHKVTSRIRQLTGRAATTAIPYTELTVAEGNFDRSRSPINKIVIHTMVGTVQGAASRFANYGSGNGPASAHYGVGYDGKLYHWLEEYFTAYHAGNYSVNQSSIGIEHEDMGKYNDPRPDALYKTSATLVRDICMYYAIPIDRQHILKHSEVSQLGTACPDSLDIDRIVREAATGSPGTPCQQKIDQITKLVEGTGQIYKYKIRQVLQK
jgi:hypothetical protein